MSFIHKKHHLISVIIATLAFVGCRHTNANDALLTRIEQLLEADSAYAASFLIENTKEQVESFDKAHQMRYLLLQAEAKNKTWEPFTTDSVMLQVVAYYDKHVTNNDRLLANYLLGCVYRDLNEVPKAIECYQNAIVYADTLSKDCDFKTLSSTYSQMADVFHRQLAISNAIESRFKSVYYSLCIKDTLNALYDLIHITADYIMQNKNDTAEALFIKAKTTYLKHGYLKEWAKVSLPLAHIYLQSGRLNDAKEILDLYKVESGEFTSEGDLPPSERMYYYYEGQFYKIIGRLDSAEYAFRQMYYPKMEYTHQDAMYRGLLDVFRQRNNMDSIYMYTLLYCQANDSSVAVKDREIISNMNAAYKYNRLQEEAFKQREKAAATLIWMIFFIALAVTLLIISFSIWVIFRRRKRQKQAELERIQRELEEAKAAYSKEINELCLLEATHQKVIKLIRNELDTSQSESEMYRSKYEDAQHRIVEINEMYEENIKIHNEEMERVKARIEDLMRKTGVSESLDTAKSFRETTIVKRVLYLAGKSKCELSKVEWETLIRVFGQFYPTLLSDLHKAPTIKDNGVKVCILVIIKLRESDIAHFLNVRDTGISNYKAEINLALFNEKSARSLFKNLEQRYGLFA